VKGNKLGMFVWYWVSCVTPDIFCRGSQGVEIPDRKYREWQ
jgi:hypothetical protein